MLQDKRFVISLTTYYLTTTDQVTTTEQQGFHHYCFRVEFYDYDHDC